MTPPEGYGPTAAPGCSRAAAIGLGTVRPVGRTPKYRLMGEGGMVAVGKIIDLELPVSSVLRFQRLADLNSARRGAVNKGIDVLGGMAKMLF